MEYSAELSRARECAALTESLGERCTRFGRRERKKAGWVLRSAACCASLSGRFLRLLQSEVHTVGRQVESQPAGLGMQLDDDAFLVLKIGDRTSLDDRHTGGYRRIVAREISRRGQIVDLALRVDAGSAYISDRDAREFELVLLLVFAVVKRAVTPGVSDTDGD